MAFINDQDLADFLGDQSLVGTEQALLNASLASGYVSELLGNPGVGDSAVTFTDLIIDGPRCPSGVIILDGFPVTNVASVALGHRDGTWDAPLVAGTDYQWNSNGILARCTLSPDATVGFSLWPSWMKSIKVTYTVGTGVVPYTIKIVCLGIAARFHSNPQGLTREQVAGYTIMFGNSATPFLGLDRSESALLANWMDWGIA